MMAPGSSTHRAPDTQGAPVGDVTTVLALQDRLRRLSVETNSTRERFHALTFGLGILAALAELLIGLAAGSTDGATLLAGIPEKTVVGRVLLGLAFCGLVSEYLAGSFRDKATQLHRLSREAFVLAINAYARGRDVPEREWQAVRGEALEWVDDAALTAHRAQPGPHDKPKFDPTNWWKTERPPGPTRLAAILLENSIVSTELFDRARRAARSKRALRLVSLLLAFLITLVLGSEGLRTSIASGVILFLTYTLATDTLDRPAMFEAAHDRLKELQRRLKNVEARLADGDDLIAATTMYCTAVVVAPPIPTAVYESFPDSQRPSNQRLEEELLGKQ